MTNESRRAWQFIEALVKPVTIGELIIVTGFDGVLVVDTRTAPRLGPNGGRQVRPLSPASALYWWPTGRGTTKTRNRGWMPWRCASSSKAACELSLRCGKLSNEE